MVVAERKEKSRMNEYNNFFIILSFASVIGIIG